MFLAASLFVASAIAGATAQNVPNLSAQCQSAVAAAAVGPASKCLGIPKLLTTLIAPPNQSIVKPVDEWLSMTCAQPTCDNFALASVVTNITNGCQAELRLQGNNDVLATIRKEVPNFYPEAREAICLKDSNANGAFCTTTTLRAFETASGQNLSISALTSPDFYSRLNLPREVTCSQCMQAAYTIVKPKLDASTRTSEDQRFAQLCGANFINGGVPSNIKAQAVSKTSGALSMGSGAVGAVATGLLAVAGAAVLGL